jgi:hypothetical protein
MKPASTPPLLREWCPRVPRSGPWTGLCAASFPGSWRTVGAIAARSERGMATAYTPAGAGRRGVRDEGTSPAESFSWFKPPVPGREDWRLVRRLGLVQLIAWGWMVSGAGR